MQEEGLQRTLRLQLRNSVALTPNRICCNALLAAYARAKTPQWKKVSDLPQMAQLHAACRTLMSCAGAISH
jgi:hypothetical protein